MSGSQFLELWVLDLVCAIRLVARLPTVHTTGNPASKSDCALISRPMHCVAMVPMILAPMLSSFRRSSFSSDNFGRSTLIPSTCRQHAEAGLRMHRLGEQRTEGRRERSPCSNPLLPTQGSARLSPRSHRRLRNWMPNGFEWSIRVPAKRNGMLLATGARCCPLHRLQTMTSIRSMFNLERLRGGNLQLGLRWLKDGNLPVLHDSRQCDERSDKKQWTSGLYFNNRIAARATKCGSMANLMAGSQQFFN
jgi:hypothetical protein